MNEFPGNHAKYFAYELSRYSSSNSTQKIATMLVDALVHLNPHQVEAAQFVFYSPLIKGAILADEVVPEPFFRKRQAFVIAHNTVVLDFSIFEVRRTFGFLKFS